MRDGHTYILPILFTENEIANRYYISKKIYKVGKESGLNSGIKNVNSEFETKKFGKLHDLVKYFLECEMVTKHWTQIFVNKKH